MNRTWLLLALSSLILLCSCSDGDSGSPATPTASPATTEAELPAVKQPPTPTPPVVFPSAITLTAGAPVPLPPGTVLYTQDGQWEGASGSLRRFYIDAAGNLREDELLASAYGEDQLLLRRAFADGDGRLWADMCHGICYGGPDPVTTMRSGDGGITWENIWESDNLGAYVLAIDEDDLLLVDRYSSNMGWELLRQPIAGGLAQLVAIAPPRTDPIMANTPGGVSVVAAADDGRRLLDVDTGDVLVSVPIPNPFQFVHIQGFAPGSEGEELLVSWRGPGAPGEADAYLGWLNISTGQFIRVLRMQPAAGLSGDIFRLHWVNEHTAIARIGLDASRYVPGHPTTFTGVPAVLDFAAGTVHPLEPFTDKFGAKAGGPAPVHIESGLFARVSTSGECLNVRTEPSTDAPVLGCYVDGVLLRLRAEVNADWMTVITPDGRTGWASAEFLER